MNTPAWRWNEIQQVGTDYTDITEVQKYDDRMGTIRDVNAENQHILGLLNLPANSAILEIGCGTGQFARCAAQSGHNVTAIDISTIMLEYVQAKASQLGTSITTQHAGFLTMDFPADTFDAVVSGLALHHLPDTWKYIALTNIARILKPAGQFILRDVVFSYNQNEPPETSLKNFIDSVPPEMFKEVARHVASEFSTYDWIMQGLLERAGFTIISTTTPAPAQTIYHCKA